MENAFFHRQLKKPLDKASFCYIRNTSIGGDVVELVERLQHLSHVVSLSLEVSQNPIKPGCNTRLKRVRVLPRKTDLKLYFELGLNRLSVVRDF